MTVRMLVLVLLVIGISQSASAQVEDKAGSDFALETEAVIASRQIQKARKTVGKPCSSQEGYYWKLLVDKYLAHGREKKAEELWFDLLRECAQQKSYLHPDTLQVAEAIVRFYGVQAQPHKVNSFLEELMLMGEQQAGNKEEKLLPLLDTCSGLYGAAGHIGKQEEVLRRGLAIVIDSNRASRLDVAQRKVHLADFLFEHERMPEAEELYLQNAPLLLEELAEENAIRKPTPFGVDVIVPREELTKELVAEQSWPGQFLLDKEVIEYLRQDLDSAATEKRKDD